MRVNLIPEEFNAQGGILPVGRPQLHRVPPDPEHIPLEGDVVALIADVHQPTEQLVPLHGHPHPQGDHHFLKVLRFPQTVDAGHRGHHNHVPPLKQSGSGGQAQPVDLVVHRGVLFDEGVRVGDIGLRLIVVVIGHEILHRIVREELLKLRAQLGGQGLVVGQHQGGTLHRFDDLGHGEGFARAGDPQQGLLVQPGLESGGQLGNGLRLVAGGLIF